MILTFYKIIVNSKSEFYFQIICSIINKRGILVYKYKAQPTNRQLRIAELIKREISMIFTTSEIYHPALEGMYLTIIDVKISVDLKIATIFITSLKKDIENELIELLNYLAPEYRKKLTSRVKLKYIPTIRFVIDKA